MALPTIGNVGTFSPGDWENPEDIQISVPTGMVTGQVALVFVYNQSANAVTPVGTYASSMHELTPYPFVSSRPNSLHVFWHAASSGTAETGTYDFEWTTSQDDNYDMGVAIRISGADPDDPVDVYTSTTLATASVNGPQVQVTPTGPDRLLFWAGATYDGGNWGTAVGSAWRGSPSGYIINAYNESLGVASLPWPTQTASGLVRGVTSISSTHTAWLIAVKPAAVASGPEPGRMLMAVS